MSMAPSLRLPIRAALAGVLAANFATAAQAADKVAVGTGGSASDAPFYIAYDKGFFKDEGLDVDLIVLDSGAKVIAPLGTGELDVGSGALSVGFWNALVRGIKFRIVADRGHAQPGYLYQTVFMRKDLVDSGQFKSLKDLKGLRMGFAAQGVTSLSLLNEAAKYAGIKFEDITPVYLSFPQQIAALQNKALDGTLLIEPQATVAVNAGYGVRFMDTNEFYPYQQISVIFFSDKFATQRKDVAEKFMRAWLRGVRSYNHAIKDGKIAGVGADEIVDHGEKLQHESRPRARDVLAGRGRHRRGECRGRAEGSRLLPPAGLGHRPDQGERRDRHVVCAKGERRARPLSAEVAVTVLAKPAETARRSNMISIAGVELEMLERGHGAPLLYLHGGAGFALDAPFIDLLARERRIIAPSHPGFGRSSLPDWLDSVDDIAHVYLELMDRLGLKRTDVVGLSIGGWIAAELATKVPERFG